MLIGDLGPDLPIALDYRADPPRVVFLGTVAPGWVTMSPTFRRFLSTIHGTARRPG